MLPVSTVWPQQGESPARTACFVQAEGLRGAGDEGSLQLHEVCPPIRAFSALPTTYSMPYAASEKRGIVAGSASESMKAQLLSNGSGSSAAA